MKISVLFLFQLIWIFHSLSAQQNAVENDAEIRKVKVAIQDAILLGDTSRMFAQFKVARSLRGNQAGKALSDPIYTAPDSTAIAEKELIKIWNLSVDPLMTWELHCPELATETPASMLGAWYASEGGNQGIPRTIFRDVSNMLKAQQYSESTASVIPGFQKGSFGYTFRKEGEEDCVLSGAVQRTVMSCCENRPEACPEYKSGPFAGYRFMVSDQFPGVSKWESPLSYHMGWAVEEMIQSFIHLRDSSYLLSAEMAGEWMMEEKPTLNHSLTAKNIWGLAALYDVTGKPKYKIHMLSLIHQNVVPGLLLDANVDRQIDDTQIPFDSLVPYAQKPGRMWDASNASSWATAINAMALVNAYAVFRDRKDTVEASRLKPICETMINNLCFEINTFGTPPAGPGFRDLAYCILDALWKIGKAEKKRHSSWEKAADVLWNAGVARSGNEYAVVTGQYVRMFSNAVYKARYQLIVE